MKDLTFIIPVRIESEDRRKNALATLGYLCHHLASKIIILEEDKVAKVPDILDKLQKNNMEIDYHFIPSSNELFHRTRLLNIMLKMVTTNVVVNYDLDILLKPETYKKSYDLVRSGYDLVYPYFWGESQYRVNSTGREKIILSHQLDLASTDYDSHTSQYGHCQFFNTRS